MHPTIEQLHAWLDDEQGSVSGGESVAAHVEGCARCRHVVTGGRQLGDALRLWADSTAPAPRGDLAGRIMAEAQLGRGLRLWAESAAPEPSGDLADWVFQAAGAAPPSTQPATAPTTTTTITGPALTSTPDAATSVSGANVVSLASRRRRWLWGAVPLTLAAAAAAVFALARPHDAPRRPVHRGTEVAHGPAHSPSVAPVVPSPERRDESVTARRGDPEDPTRQGANVGDEAATSETPPNEGPAAQVAQADKGGTDVLALHSNDEVFSVVQVEGHRPGSTLAVAWFEDTKHGANSVE